MEIFASCSGMPAQLLQSIPVTSLQPDKNQEGENSIREYMWDTNQGSWKRGCINHKTDMF